MTQGILVIYRKDREKPLRYFPREGGEMDPALAEQLGWSVLRIYEGLPRRENAEIKLVTLDHSGSETDLESKIEEIIERVN